MATIIGVRGFTPVFGKECFFAPTASVIGDVVCGDHCSFWFSSVVRGDVNSIRIGNYSNIQDGAVIHGTFNRSGTEIGDYVSVGHNAIVHGARLGNHILAGMTSVILDEAVVEDYCIIAAGAVVLERSICESGFIYAGVPARKLKPLTAEQRRSLEVTPMNYVLYSSWFNKPEV